MDWMCWGDGDDDVAGVDDDDDAAGAAVADAEGSHSNK